MPLVTATSPQPFGYKTAWIAVDCEPEAVVSGLQLSAVSEVGWAEGVERAYAGACFVAPQINGWTLAVSSTFLDQSGRILDHVLGLVRDAREVQFFATHRVAEFHHWMRFRDRKIARTFAFVGESGEVVSNAGRTTLEEMAIGLPDLDGLSLEEATDRLFEADAIPDEDWVMELAARWSVNPATIDQMGLPASAGLIGTLPLLGEIVAEATK